MTFFAEHIGALLGMAGLLLCSGFFSGTETALFSLSRGQVIELRGHSRPAERMLALLSDNPSGLLITILFGNLVVNILFFSMSAVLALDVGRRFGAGGQALVGGGVLLLVILMGEIIPKAVAISFPLRIARMNALPLLGWFHFFGPVRRGLEIITHKMEPKEEKSLSLDADELKMLIDSTHHDQCFGKQEKAIVEDIVNFPEIRVRELMVPRVKQLFRRADAPAGEALLEATERELELFPIYEEDEDNVVGVVDVRDLFINENPMRPLSDFAGAVKFVPETKRADEMLREFFTEELRLVCVVDEYGGLAGTVCLEDLLEEVVGEFDVLDVPSVEQLGESTYRLQGSLGIREWRSLFVGLLPDEVMRDLALDTLSGLVVSLLKRLPKVGDVAHVGNLRFTVDRVRAHRIERILLERIEDDKRS